MLIGTVVSQQELGILKRRRATPLPAWALIVSQSLAVLLMAFASIVVLLLVAGVAFATTMPLAGAPTLVAAVLFGARKG